MPWYSPHWLTFLWIKHADFFLITWKRALQKLLHKSLHDHTSLIWFIPDRLSCCGLIPPIGYLVAFRHFVCGCTHRMPSLGKARCSSLATMQLTPKPLPFLPALEQQALPVFLLKASWNRTLLIGWDYCAYFRHCQEKEGLCVNECEHMSGRQGIGWQL